MSHYTIMAQCSHCYKWLYCRYVQVTSDYGVYQCARCSYRTMEDSAQEQEQEDTHDQEIRKQALASMRHLKNLKPELN